MSELKLKEDTTIKYDELTQCYHFPQMVNCKHKKIASRAFPNLMGKNKWESAGKTILSLCKLEQFEPIDPFYTLRGDIGELLVFQYFNDTYPVKLRTWTKKEVDYDNFKNNLNFGGLIDIAITGLEEGFKNEEFTDDSVRAVIEVKSKSLIKRYKGNAIDNRKTILEEGLPIEETLQGEFLGHMSKVTAYIMTYIFFNEEQEETLKECVKTIKDINNYNPHEVLRELGWTYKDVVIEEFRNIVRNEFIEQQMKYTLNTLNQAVKTGNIHKMFFSNQDKIYLDNIIMNGGKKETITTKDNEEWPKDLPF